ncbi:MAG: SRPBCC domain-containing protein [Ilumatobacter sp.]|uniref:SRPBCC domain-containing protein n=1 Tax=Ilumatobacter sp. TaxID=1967498 RepID=UPI0032986755
MTTPSTVHTRAGEQSLSFTREFDAPAALVFRAHTEPNLFGRWTGPRGTTCDLEHFDATTGGSFRYSVIGDQPYTFHGCYHEVTAPTRIVHTWEFVGDPGRPTLETLTFVELGNGRCRIEGQSVYTSAEQCAEMLEFDQSGDGMDENFERLDTLLADELG